jgi:hypothetical protein
MNNKVIITGGHFMIVDNKAFLNIGTINSFKKAVYKFLDLREEGVFVKLGLLINDIGVVCGTNSCVVHNGNAFVRDSFVLPIEYRKILKENKIKEKEVLIFWEKHIKNRAKKFLRKKMKSSNNFFIKNNNIFYENEMQKILISRVREHDKYGSVACPLIMAQFHKEQEILGFTRSFNFYYIGVDNLLNIPVSEVMDISKKLNNLVGTKIEITNILIK